jgi:hypothetical protein
MKYSAPVSSLEYLAMLIIYWHTCLFNSIIICVDAVFIVKVPLPDPLNFTRFARKGILNTLVIAGIIIIFYDES